MPEKSSKLNVDPKTFSYESMGTSWKISIWDKLDNLVMEEIRHYIMNESLKFDQTYSRFIKTSLVWKLTKKTGIQKVSDHFIKMLKWYQDLYLVSDKKLNPLIGFMISDLGYDADYSLETKNVIRKVPDLLEVVSIVDHDTIKLKEPVLFDFGALGKGYFVDIIAAFLRQRGVRRYLVDGSGDIFYCGHGDPIRVGLEHPGDSKMVIGVVEMKKGAMCSSGSNRRSWGDFHHIIDIDKAASPKQILATWVMADQAVLADALATALFLVPPENLEKQFKFEYLILNDEYRVKKSLGFVAELF